MRFVKSIAVLAVLLGFVATGLAQMPTLGPGGTNARYATDAYPGFDSEDDNLKPERKEPHWWWFMVGGPSRENAADEFAYCQELVAEGSYSKACRELDNLVRQWPTAPEAWKAQQLRAELLLGRMDDPEESFKAYQYLLDFYSLPCDYSAIADKLYEIAGILKLEGKEVMFVRFANTVDVRRAYEKCILRAPGAKWVPEAMLIIAGLREDEGVARTLNPKAGSRRNIKVSCRVLPPAIIPTRLMRGIIPPIISIGSRGIPARIELLHNELARAALFGISRNGEFRQGELRALIQVGEEGADRHLAARLGIVLPIADNSREVRLPHVSQALTYVR